MEINLDNSDRLVAYFEAFGHQWLVTCKEHAYEFDEPEWEDYKLYLLCDGDYIDDLDNIIYCNERVPAISLDVIPKSLWQKCWDSLCSEYNKRREMDKLREESR